MIFRKSDNLGPGEARTRQRQRRQMIYIACAGLIGGVTGFLTGAFDRGDGSLFAGDWDKLALDPAVAVLIAVLLVLGFVALPLYGFCTIDEHKREQNLIAFTGGTVAVLAGFPVWAVLHAGGLGSAPHPFGVWLLAMAGMVCAYFFAIWRA